MTQTKSLAKLRSIPIYAVLERVEQRFFRQKRKEKKTLEAASCTRSIDSFFKTLDYGTDDEPETPLCELCNEDAVPAFATYAEAIAELGKLQLFSRDARIDSRRTGMT